MTHVLGRGRGACLPVSERPSVGELPQEGQDDPERVAFHQRPRVLPVHPLRLDSLLRSRSAWALEGAPSSRYRMKPRHQSERLSCGETRLLPGFERPVTCSIGRQPQSAAVEARCVASLSYAAFLPFLVRRPPHTRGCCRRESHRPAPLPIIAVRAAASRQRRRPSFPQVRDPVELKSTPATTSRKTPASRAPKHRIGV